MTGVTDKLKKNGIERDRCFICGKSEKLTRTPCCDMPICDDNQKYVPFSYAHNSCFRNHSRYTLCSYHFGEEHEGDWQTCKKCREDFQTEMYVYYGTNEYNHTKLKDPPKFEPKKCDSCGRIIKLSEDACTLIGDKYYCMTCRDI